MQTSQASGTQHFSPGPIITILLIRNENPHQYRSILQIDMITSIGCNYFTLLDWPPESPDNQYHLNK